MVGALGIASLCAVSAPARADGVNRFEGFSTSGWLYKWKNDLTHGNAPGNVLEVIVDVRTGKSHSLDYQHATPKDLNRYGSVNWTKRGRRLAQWIAVARTVGKKVLFELTLGKKRIALGRVALSRRGFKLRKVRWGPGARVVLFETTEGNTFYRAFVVPQKLHVWRHALAKVPACAMYRRWMRCVARALPKRRRRTLRGLKWALRRIHRSKKASRARMCKERARKLKRRYAKDQNAKTCLF